MDVPKFEVRAIYGAAVLVTLLVGPVARWKDGLWTAGWASSCTVLVRCQLLLELVAVRALGPVCGCLLGGAFLS